MSHKRIRSAAESAQVDGDKKGMGGYESKMRMDDMPIDWVEQVISFLSLTDVFKCKSVCRKWNVAADRVLSDWETLVLKDDEQWPHGAVKNQIFLDEDGTWIERLKQLVRLKQIFVLADLRPKLVPVVDDIVLRNAKTLTLLDMCAEVLPVDPNQPVVFPNLRDLNCNYLYPDEVTALPRLVELWTRTSVKVLQKLPAETMTNLVITELEFETGSHEEIEQMVADLSRLTRLKRLSLRGGFRYFYPYQWTDLHDRAISKLFTNMKELEVVEIESTEDRPVNVDAAIETLVQYSPSVRSIRMINCEMTDASFQSLSRLTGLQELAIRSDWWDGENWRNEITTEGILSLLRGGSRNVLRDLKLNTSVSPDLGQIRAEVELMQHEMARTLMVETDSFPPHFPVAHALNHTLRIY